MQIRINEPLETKLKRLAEENRRTPTAEGQIAVEKHVSKSSAPARKRKGAGSK